jgi:C1A family cysteine protease
VKRRCIPWYGWTPDLPDNRDLAYPEAPKVVHLPDVVDLRPQCPPVVDQGALGSCTANAIASAYDFERGRQGLPFMSPSRLFIYFQERDMEGTVDFDSGAQIRDGVKAIVNQGLCPESDWPYDISQFTVKPPQPCYDTALQNQALKYRRISNNLMTMMSCLATGLPFVYGFSVYDSFESDLVASTGVMNMPTATESVIGGHAVMAVGYDRPKQMFLVQNSWSTSWGIGGYFWMPFIYLANPNLADDRWVISQVESGQIK